MGVPSFFSWLIKRYPLCLHNIEKGQGPIIDNLYLDMNGILYKCARDEATVFKDLLQKKNYEELYANVFNYINQIINQVAPRKLIYLSFDGPAPRAKMNQQRTRRFCSAKSYKQLNEALYIFGKQPEMETFKNNSISPGTEFMHELNKQLQFFIMKKFEDDDHWKQLEVIYSGSNVAGEGEHKIINYIRQLTQQENFDTSSTHCIYGADADLIMLGLSTHIKYMSIIREEMPQFQRIKVSKAAKRTKSSINFQIIYLNIVKEYMELEYQLVKQDMKNKDYYDIDKIIDDFIFLCFFIGNDFLPRCYGFNIREGNFELLIDQYKEYLIEGNPYINNGGELNLKALEILMVSISKFEKQFIEERYRESQKLIKQSEQYNQNEDEEDEKNEVEDNPVEKLENDIIQNENEFLKELCKSYKESEKDGRLYYYKEKLDLDIKNNIQHLNELDKMLQSYINGLQFVLYYYYKSIPSWSWYYPYYYSPMTSDILQYLKYHNEKQDLKKIEFNLDQPYTPLKQLLCILHPDNSDLLPDEFKKLLINEKSPLRYPKDYYPNDFKQDAYGALFEHEYIAILPFLDDKLINDVYNKIDFDKISEKDKERNAMSDSYKISYSKNFPQIEIKSTLPDCFRDFSIRCKIEYFKLDMPQQINYKFPNPSGTPRFPSLLIKKIKNYFLHYDKVKKKSQLQIIFENQNNLEEIYNDNISINFYIGYPNCIECEFIGYLDQNGLIKQQKNIPDILIDYGYNYKQYEHVYQDIMDDIYTAYKKHGIILKDINRVALVKLFHQLRRTSDGQLHYNKKIYTEQMIPEEMLILDKTNKIAPYFELKQFKNIEYEFPKQSKVAIFGQDNQSQFNYIGIVENYKDDKNNHCTDIIVKLKKKPWTMKTDQLRYYQADKNLYYNIQFVSKKLDLDISVILDILDSIYVQVDKDKSTGQKLPDQLDIGLNIIQRQQNLIVPLLVRVPLAEEEVQGKERYQQFEKYLELSDQLVQIIQKYKQLYPQVFIAIQQKQKENQQYNQKLKNDNQKKSDFTKKPRHKIKISPKYIFPKSTDPNIDIVDIYIWIMQLDTSKLALASISSKSMPSERINQLQTLSKNLDEKLEKHQYKVNKTIQINPNFACRQNFYTFIPLYFKDHPYHHQVGDRIINLNCSTLDSIPFGLFGTIVGVSNFEIEVLFDKEFIGGSNLGGRCKHLRGAVLQFTDVFNLECWNEFLIPRDTQVVKWGWDYQVEEYKPEFSMKGIVDDWQYNQYIDRFKINNSFQQNTQSTEAEKIRTIQDLDLSANQQQPILKQKEQQVFKVIYEQQQEEETKEQQQQVKVQDNKEEQKQDVAEQQNTQTNIISQQILMQILQGNKEQLMKDPQQAQQILELEENGILK